MTHLSVSVTLALMYVLLILWTAFLAQDVSLSDILSSAVLFLTGYQVQKLDATDPPTLGDVSHNGGECK